MAVEDMEPVNNADIAQTFVDNKVILTAFITAVLTQIIIAIVSEIRLRRDLNNKRNLILFDLKDKQDVLRELRIAYQSLLEKFQRKDVDNHKSRAFTELNADFYNAVTKPELYKIFNTRLTDIAEAYNMICFLKQNDVHFIYTDYLVKIENHTNAKKDDPKHEKFCPTHIGFIQTAIHRLQAYILATDAAIAIISLILQGKRNRSAIFQQALLDLEKNKTSLPNKNVLALLFGRAIYKKYRKGSWWFRGSWAPHLFLIGTVFLTAIVYEFIINPWMYSFFVLAVYTFFLTLRRYNTNQIPVYEYSTKNLRANTPFFKLNVVLWIASILPFTAVVRRETLTGESLALHRKQQGARLIMYTLICVVLAYFSFRF